jgi:glycerate 2-kinase
MHTHNLLLQLFNAALEAAMPDGKFGAHLPPRPKGRTLVLGAGKGSARMAQAFEREWGAPVEGLVVTRYGHACPTRSIEIVEAAHPVPDESGLKTAARCLALAQSAGPDDLVIFLMSGGASSLLSLPAQGLSLADKQEVNRKLLKSGMPIGAMNQIRKSLSAIKGGRLAAAAVKAQLVTFLISDVPGDDPAAIGSGPTIAEPIHAADIFASLQHYEVQVSDAVRAAILANCQAPAPAPRHAIHMLATPMMALEAAAAQARTLGLNPVILSDCIEGEAREVAKVFAGLALTQRLHPTLGQKPVVLLSGGETSVTVRGKGRGGRNAEFLLAFLQAMGDLSGIAAIACDTDGIDGVEDNAGAWIDQSLMEHPRAAGLKIADYLANNDAYTYFQTLDRLVTTGPTLTNVNDFRAILIQ